MSCSWGRCKTKHAPVVVEEDERYCRKHATWVADKLVGDWVKRRDAMMCIRCGRSSLSTVIQWAHIQTRGKRTIRWLTEPYPGNSVALCQGCHYAYTLKPSNWERYIEGRWPGHWDRLSRLQAEGERSGDAVNVAGIILRYRSEAA